MSRLRDVDLVHKLPWWVELGIIGLIMAALFVIVSPFGPSAF